jgi:hypothetical protein
MAARPKRTKWTKALRLAWWNADGVRSRKQELDHFLGQHGIDIWLLAKTHLRAREVFRLANYVCHRNDRLTEGGGTAILVRRGIVYHAVPVQGLQHLEATAIQVMLTVKPVKILAAYLLPTRPLIASDLSTCLPPRRAGFLCGRYGHHSHVSSASAPRQIPGDLSQRPRTVVE